MIALIASYRYPGPDILSYVSHNIHGYRPAHNASDSVRYYLCRWAREASYIIDMVPACEASIPVTLGVGACASNPTG
jgi:hypothetical protein